MGSLPGVDCELGNARAHTDGDLLVVTTGYVTRTWQLTDAGFSTRSVTHLPSDKEYCGVSSDSDWQLPDRSEPSSAELKGLTASVQNDEGFTSDHICVSAEIDYQLSGYSLRFTLWAYPDAGIRSQLSAKLLPGKVLEEETGMQGKPPEPRVDRLPVRDLQMQRRFFGYYNDTQNRNNTHHDILKEELSCYPLSSPEVCSWASVACLENDDGGFALVKESHKCVNQRGYAGGEFVCEPDTGLSCLGWGLQPEELSTEEYTSGWATWCLAWAGADLEREVAFKTFDACRFPIDPERDIYVQANTWGSTDNGSDARRAASEESVLEELDSCADLGIDSLQIDDGWQVPPGNHTWQPGDNGWRPHPDGYPEGWKNIRAHAEKLGVKLGIWAAAVPISLEELKSNYEKGGFIQHKLDFASLRNRGEIDDLMHKVREFVKFTGHSVRVNWDVTEVSPRYGYFFAREYGCIYLENRKPVRPIQVVYRPHTVLRDLWQVSKYLNLHRFQCSIQNVDRVDQELSDAHMHSHSYCVAIALMGIPLFFQQTKYYTEEARKDIRPLLNVYKTHRDRIYRGIVHPIGDKPDNGSWSGFQCHLPDEDAGYLMLFRERCNDQTEHAYRLGWLTEGAITVTDLMHSTTDNYQVRKGGEVSFIIERAPAFRFLQYSADDNGRRQRTTIRDDE